jgi:hypothetical protein
MLIAYDEPVAATSTNPALAQGDCKVGWFSCLCEGPLIFRTVNPLGFASEREDVIVWETAVVYSRV